MKNQEKFDDTINILVAAYLNNSLMHRNCHACAVGNMIAAHLNITYDQNLKWIGRQVAWKEVFVTFRYHPTQIKRPWAYTGEAKAQIDATGYSWQELSRLEYAFEKAAKGNTQEEHLFNGLMAVVDVLCQIHEVTQTAHTAARHLFAPDLDPATPGPRLV
jgi:hypothetical protein